MRLVQTTHICSMLRDALRLAEEAEEADFPANATTLLLGAAVQARHAAAELDDEFMRLNFPGTLKA